MSSVAETSKLREDSEEPISRRRGLRLVACLVENKKAGRLPEKKPGRNFNIAICDDIFSEPGKRAHGADRVPTKIGETGAAEQAPHQTNSKSWPLTVAATLLAGGVLGYLIGSKRK